MSSYYVHPLDMPDMDNQQAVYEFVTKDIGLSMITPTRIKDAVKSKELAATKISGNNHFTRRNVLRWLESVGVAIDWQRSDLAAKRDYASRELIETNAALEAVMAKS